jgi:lipoprotein-anchoring transpeptidase ErfK/SrfK
MLAGLAALGWMAAGALATELQREPAPVRLEPAIEQFWIDQLKQPDDRMAETAGRAPLLLASHKARKRRGTTGADIVFGRQDTKPARNRARRNTGTLSVARESRPRGVDAAYLPALVDFDLDYAPGTIIIDTRSRFLYLTLEGGKARRYGVGVGRTGFGWKGDVKIGRKAEWPGWTPPAAMRERQPGLPVHMEGGIDNPLGARALYLYRGGRDTIYRIHGSNEPWTIGQAVSSGCFRMRNEDVTDLYERVGVGTRVVVM